MKKPVTRDFPKEFLLQLLHTPWPDGAELVEDELEDLADHGLSLHSMVFEFEGKFFRTLYEKGEYNAPFETEGDLIECHEVEEVELICRTFQPVFSGE